jgi:hypothetical protein
MYRRRQRRSSGPANGGDEEEDVGSMAIEMCRIGNQRDVKKELTRSFRDDKRQL